MNAMLAPLVGRPRLGSMVHLQQDDDIRSSLCGDGVKGGSWEIDALCPKCWATLLERPRYPAAALRDNVIALARRLLDTPSDQPLLRLDRLNDLSVALWELDNLSENSDAAR